MLTSAWDGLTLGWPRRVLHSACLTAKHMHTLADVYKITGALSLVHTCSRTTRKTDAHTFLDTCGRLMTAVCTRVCTQTHVCTLAEQRTLLDYFNSLSFHWFRGLFWNITAVLGRLAVDSTGSCAPFLKANWIPVSCVGSCLADGAYPDAVYLDRIGLPQVLQSKDWSCL